jgi:hypothetical protein
MKEKRLSTITDCYKITYSLLDGNNIVCKPHPRSTCKIDDGIKEFSYQGVPMEVIYSLMDDLCDRILVGNLSTALFSPKLMFGKEPYVISIHRIIDSNVTEYDSIYYGLYSLYIEKDRIFAPKNLQEFSEVLLHIVKS